MSPNSRRIRYLLIFVNTLCLGESFVFLVNFPQRGLHVTALTRVLPIPARYVAWRARRCYKITKETQTSRFGVGFYMNSYGADTTT